MAEMGRYCKAYTAKDLAAFEGWQPDLQQLRPAEPQGDDAASEPATRETLADDDVLFLHEDFIVTDGIYHDENIVFKNVDEAWKAFCTDQLAFAVPEDVAQLPVP